MQNHYDRIQNWLVPYLAQTLELDPDDIGTGTPFGRLGLDSSASIILVGELMEWLERPLEPDIVYHYPTVQALSRHLAETLYGERVA
jgi:acyl carrier protein